MESIGVYWKLLCRTCMLKTLMKFTRLSPSQSMKKQVYSSPIKKQVELEKHFNNKPAEQNVAQK